MAVYGIIANISKPRAGDILRKIIRFLERRGREVYTEAPAALFLKQKKRGLPEAELVKGADIIIAVGGDGTFLRAARLMHKNPKPVLGVNLGRLGFLAETASAGLEKCLERLISGRYYTDYRMTLDTAVLRKNRKIRVLPALNDVVINKMVISRVIDLEVFIDGHYVAGYKADGILASTPTGSTAYNLSSGGPIVRPGSNVIVMSPICPHTLMHRPLVISSGCRIEIEFGMPADTAELTVDGQVGISLKSADRVVITRGEKDVPVILFNNRSYFNVLRRKLGWGVQSARGKNK